ncbi:MAG: cytochrome c biogenesis protein ResB [Anaerolineae bacterium]|jgi:cytochrome c biogenesis protein
MRTPLAWLGKAWRSLYRLRTGVILLTALLGAIVSGTLFPQAPQAGASTAWWEAVRDRYGFLYTPLRALGLFDVFDAPWFWGLMGLLALSTLACFLNRLRPLARLVLRPRIHLPEARFEQGALRARLTFPTPQAAESALRARLRGYRLQVERDDDGLYLRADRLRLSRWGTLLTHASLVLLLLGAAWGNLWGWRAPALAVGSDQVTEVGHGTGVGLRCEGLEITRYDDGTPRDYRADVTFVGTGGKQSAQGTLRVNHPIKRAGVSYYLQGYRLSESGACDVTLSAVHDPSYNLMLIAGLGLLLGMTLTFHLPHRRLWARLGPSGEVALVSATDWDQARLARQFEDLVNDLENAAERAQARVEEV